MLVLAAGVVIIFLSLGIRNAFGLFLDPLTRQIGAGREVYGLAIALQNLLWGIGQPIAGMIADKLGSTRVILVGGALYAGGLALAAVSAGSASLYLSLGLLIGLGLSATSYAVVLGAVGKHFVGERRTRALGIASVGGSLGMFVSIPGSVSLIDSFGWTNALFALGAIVALICVLAPVAGRSPPEVDGEARAQTLRAALREAAAHRGFVLLNIGFFACGFQLAFIATHLPAYAIDKGLPPWVGSSTLGVTELLVASRGRKTDLAHLAHEEFLAGEYSIADIACFPWVRIHKLANLSMEACPHLKRWYGVIRRRPAVERGLSVLREHLTGVPNTETAHEIMFGKSQFRST